MTTLDHPTDGNVTTYNQVMLKEEMTVPQAIAATLEDAGIDLVLGLCAGFTTPLFEALYEHPSINTIQVRQELLGSLAANAYGRLTSRPAIISGEGEFILGTATQGILESLLGSSPMVIITEMFDGGRMAHHGNYHSGSGEHGSYDAVTAFRGICKKVFVSHYPAQAVQHIQLAIKHALTGDPGPVCVILHSTCLEETVGPDSFPRIYPTSGYVKSASPAVDTAGVLEAAAVIGRASAPVIIAGNGVRISQAYDALRDAAYACDAPVVTTQGGKGVFDETDPLGGGVFGEWGKESANALVSNADLVLAVGTKLGPLDTVDQIPDLIDPTRQTIIQIDIEPTNAAWTLPVENLLVGDAKPVLTALAEAAGEVTVSHPVSAADRVSQARADRDLPRSAHHESDEFPLRPERLVGLIQETWPDDAIITTDAGESRTFMLNWFSSHGEGRYLVPHGGGGMGYATSAAFGAKLAFPNRPALGVCGDGGFAMTMNTLMNARQEGVSFAVVVFNNKALGWPLHTMPEHSHKFFEFYDFDHAAIARSMGCDGKRCESVADVRQALEEALSSPVPYVIDVPITLEATFQESTASIAKQPRERPWRVKAE